jgi:LacI family transcriptional regulator, galactose operon repressor
MSPTLADVARAAGVHPGTASRALNPESRGLVAASTARRVLAAANRLGYQPNTVARALRTRRSNTVGLLLPDLTNPLFPPIVRGVEEVLGADGMIALIANTDNDAQRERALFAALRGRQCDGFVLLTARRKDEVVEIAVAEKVPLVLVNRLTDKRLVPAVAGDEAVAVAEALAHLAELGHRRILHIAGPQAISTGVIRYHAFMDSLGRTGLDADDCSVVFASAYSEDAGREAMARGLSAKGSRPTAVLAANDLIAFGAIDALRSAGLDCPSDVSVIGFNDLPMAARVLPSLTTISLPKREMGIQAARLLRERIDDPDSSDARCLLLPCPLVVRESTARVRRGKRARGTHPA